MRAGIKSPFEFGPAFIEPFARPMIQRLPASRMHDDMTRACDGWTTCFTKAWSEGRMTTDPHGREIQFPWDEFGAALEFQDRAFAPKVEGAAIGMAAFYPTDVAVRRGARFTLQVGEKRYADVPAIAFAAGFKISSVVCPKDTLVRIDVFADDCREDELPPLYVHVGIVLPHVVR